MNLIEQLGGYERAKNIRLGNEEDWMFYSIKKDWYSDIKHDDSFIFIDGLKYELLEHRRANNIFEVGDYVLPNSDHSNEVHFLSDWYIKDLDFRYKTKSGGWGVIVKSCMSTAWRHATDEEIKAGHRL